MGAASAGAASAAARPRCPLCARAGAPLHTGLVDPLGPAPGEWSYRRCSDASCGAVWIDPLPSAADLARAYERYYTHESDDGGVPRGGGVFGAARVLWRWTRVARERRSLESLVLAERAPGRLLELGCGSGARLAALRAAGWEVEGQEVDARAAEVARRSAGATVHVGPLAELALPDSRYDAIASSHVLEHVAEPEALLRECYRLLRPGGRLVAITPNAAALGHRCFGRDWLYLDPPRHLHVFTPPALERLARGAGLVAEVWTTSARAETVAAASLARRRPGLADGGAFARSARDLAAVAFQLAGQVYARVRPGSGEECVLVAERPAP